MKSAHYQNLASISLIGLIFLCLSWELWLAPLRPGGSWMIVKAFVLLPAVFGILKGKRYTYKWMSLMVQLYLLEGLTRATSETGTGQWLAVGEILLSLSLFTSIVLYLRSTRAPSLPKNE